MSDLFITGRPTMAEIVAMTVGGLVKMEQRGLPIHQKLREGNVYHLPTVWRWLKADQARQWGDSRSVELSKELFARRARADARKAELEVAKLEESVLPVEFLRRGLEGVAINQRTILLSLPAQIGREIDEPEIRVRVVTIVGRRVREALEVLAGYDPVIDERDESRGACDDVDQDDLSSDHAAAETHDQPVGRAETVSEPRRRRVGPLAKRHRAVPH